jgi:hypothetical protein
MNLDYGAFSGDPVTRWLSDGRTMQLVEPFSYTDPDGRVWAVPAGFLTDGASIPRALWSTVGGPFEGPYRVAALLHDYVCAIHTTAGERQAGDRMFYRACLCAGCSDAEARRLFAGVRLGTWADQIGDGLHAIPPVGVAPDPPGV